MNLHSMLTSRRLTLAVAESCTGGLTAKLITDSPGSSSYFLLGIVAYSNQAKIGLLDVPAALLKKRGAVSADTTIAMARGARARSGADCGIGITGMAGPSGGSAAKPVGTVFIAVATPRGTTCKRCRFAGSRSAIRMRAARSAIRLLLAALEP